MNTKSTRRRKVGVMIALVGFILIIFGKLLAAAVLLAASAHAAPNSDGRLYGDPTGAVEYWHPQHTGDCGLMAVADIVGQFTGKSPTEQQIIALAEQTPSVVRPGQPVWTPPTDPNDITTASGSKAPDEVVLLAKLGIDAVVTDIKIAATSDGIPTGLEALERYLAGGHKVLVHLDSGALYGQGKPTYTNHVVVVTGVDTTAAVVHLNDSLDTHGDTTFSIDTFMKAWSTTDKEKIEPPYTMVVTVDAT